MVGRRNLSALRFRHTSHASKPEISHLYPDRLATLARMLGTQHDGRSAAPAVVARLAALADVSAFTTARCSVSPRRNTGTTSARPVCASSSRHGIELQARRVIVCARR
jgi:hypothetical protein